MHSTKDRPIIFTPHSLLRARQYGWEEDQLIGMLNYARKIKDDGRLRIYETGGTRFIAMVYSDKVVIKTITDEYLARNEYQR